MPAAADPELAYELAKTTLDIYSKAVEQLLQIIARRLAHGIDQPGWPEQKLLEQVALRNQVQAVIDTLDANAPDVIAQAIEKAHGLGSTQAATELAADPTITTVFGTTNTRAVDALVRETVQAVTGTHRGILRTTLDMYRSVIAQTSAPGVLTGTVTRRQAAQQALDRFATQGITGFRDSRGRNWQLDSYVEMATRTSVGRAQVAGTLDRFEANGRDLVIVSDAPQECKLCRVWEGKILTTNASRVGERLDDGRRVVATVDQARAAGLLHANCRHRLGAYIVGLTRPMTHTADPEGDRLRQEQRRLERGVRAWKRREAAALDEASARQARAKVREWQGKLREHVDGNDLKRLRAREQVGRAH